MYTAQGCCAGGWLPEGAPGIPGAPDGPAGPDGPGAPPIPEMVPGCAPGGVLPGEPPG
jgi:hypothetical protein